MKRLILRTLEIVLVLAVFLMFVTLIFFLSFIIWCVLIIGIYDSPNDSASSYEIPAPVESIIGITSWYDYNLENYPGYSKNQRTCASRDYPRGTILKVYYQDRLTACRVNDYGPAEWTGREIDLSSLAFRDLAPLSKGIIEVKITKE